MLVGSPVALPRRVAVRRAVAWHPEWWVYAVAAAAWLALGWMDTLAMPSPGFLSSWFDGWSHWVLMVAAMMLPLVAPQVRTVGLRSVTSRHHRSAGCYVLGFVLLLATVGAALVAILVLAGLDHDSTDLLVVVLLLAAAWQGSVPRRRIVRRCSALRLGPARGIAADVDCVRAGVRSAVRCLVECWPAMLAMALSHSLVLMAGLTVVLLTERRRGPNALRRAGRPVEAWVLAGFAFASVVRLAL